MVALRDGSLVSYNNSGNNYYAWATSAIRMAAVELVVCCELISSMSVRRIRFVYNYYNIVHAIQVVARCRHHIVDGAAPRSLCQPLKTLLSAEYGNIKAGGVYSTGYGNIIAVG